MPSISKPKTGRKQVKSSESQTYTESTAKRYHEDDDQKRPNLVQNDVAKITMSADEIRKALELDDVAQILTQRAEEWNRTQVRTLAELERMRREMVSEMAFAESSTAQGYVEEKNKQVIAALNESKQRNNRLLEALKECKRQNQQHADLHGRINKIIHNQI